MKKWQNINSDGFTLIEVLVALSALGILLTAALHVFGFAIKRSALQSDKNTALEVGTEISEMLLRSFNKDDCFTRTCTFRYDKDGFELPANPPNRPGYYTVSTSPQIDSPVAGMTTVTIGVRWVHEAIENRLELRIIK